MEALGSDSAGLRGNSRNFSADFSSCLGEIYRFLHLLRFFRKKKEIKMFSGAERAFKNVFAEYFF